MAKLSMTEDALRDYLRDSRGAWIETIHVKGKTYAQVVVPTTSQSHKVRTIQIDK